MINVARPALAAEISAIVLLGGTLRAQDFHRAVRRPIVSLPLNNRETMWSRWMDSATELAGSASDGPIRLDLLVGEPTEAPAALGASPRVAAGAYVDKGDVRGSAGVLRDHIEHSTPKDFVVVANANQAVLGDFVDLVRAMASVVRDVAVMPSADGSGGFLMIARAQCLLGISGKGFIDLKEQALPTLARQYDVRVVPAPFDAGPTVVRSHGDYLRLLTRLHAGPRAVASESTGAVEDRFGDRFRLIEDGASVAPDAVVQNSVVLKGGRVGSGAAVAWCVVPEGASVEPGASARNKLVTP